MTCVVDDMSDLDGIINTTGKWGVYYRTPSNRRPQQTFQVYDKTFFKFLLDCGYSDKSRNSASMILEKIPLNLRMYWWRGYMDGDGCIYRGSSYMVSMTSSYKQDWSFVDNIPLTLKWKFVHRQTSNGNYSRCLLNTKPDCYAFTDYLYKDYHIDGIGFTRKYARYIDMKTDRMRAQVGKGYYLNKNVNRWCARITIDNKEYALGYFDDEQDAKDAVERKRNELRKIYAKNEL